jgi:hypothetical protein
LARGTLKKKTFLRIKRQFYFVNKPNNLFLPPLIFNINNYFMKKSYVLAGVLALGCITAFGQRQAGQTEQSYNANVERLMAATEAVNDTLGPGVAQGCNVGPFLTGSTNGGWVAGGNGYGDLEKAMRFPNPGSGTIYSVMPIIGAKSGSSGNFTAKIYASTAAGPSTTTGTSQPVTYANLDTTGAFTRFVFSTPVAYTGAFFASVEVDKSGSRFGVLHTADECGLGHAYEKWDDETWHAMSSASAWGLDVAMFIFVEVESTTTSAEEFLIERGTHKVVPNPAQGVSHLVYSLRNEAKNVEINVYNVTGQKVLNHKMGAQNSGLHNVNIDVNNMASGTYIYTITTDGEVSQGKFMVAE